MIYTESSISKAIDIGKNHIDNFQLTTKDGTKTSKAKFKKNATIQRNNYVNGQIEGYKELRSKVLEEINIRYNQLLPEDKTDIYNKDLIEVDNLFNLVNLNSIMSNSFKLNIDCLVARINDDCSLDDLNDVIRQFIELFKSNDIKLTIKDFDYTMFTSKYMESFLSGCDGDQLKDIFENIYFTCPLIKLQLKMNLQFIISKYSKQLENIVKDNLKGKCIEYNIKKEEIIDKYIALREDVGSKIAVDEYNNSIVFINVKRKIEDYLEGSSVRDKNFNLFFEKTYKEFSDEDKIRANEGLLNLYLTCNELKKYYKYEFIITDLLKRYKNKDNAKTAIVEKKKEIAKAEKKRLSINHDYLQATGVGLFAFKNEVKAKNAMLEMNEHIKLLNKLNEEYKDLCLTNNLNTLNESSTIYDLFIISLTSFSFLEKCFTDNEDFTDDLDTCIKNYLRFIYNPMNDFIRKVNVLVDFNITDIVTDKFRLLDMNVTSNMLASDAIDSTIDSLDFVNLVQNIGKSNISLDIIKILCDMNKIIKSNSDN